MHFELIDTVVEQGEDHLVADKLVSSAEEYLQDHFPTFPVLPGVLMLEALVQAARALVEADPSAPPLVLSGVRALRYGHFVRPGQVLRVTVHRTGSDADVVDFKGVGRMLDPAVPDASPPTAVSCRFSLRPARIG